MYRLAVLELVLEREAPTLPLDDGVDVPAEPITISMKPKIYIRVGHPCRWRPTWCTVIVHL